MAKDPVPDDRTRIDIAVIPQYALQAIYELDTCTTIRVSANEGNTTIFSTVNGACLNIDGPVIYACAGAELALSPSPNHKEQPHDTAVIMRGYNNGYISTPESTRKNVEYLLKETYNATLNQQGSSTLTLLMTGNNGHEPHLTIGQVGDSGVAVIDGEGKVVMLTMPQVSEGKRPGADHYRYSEEGESYNYGTYMALRAEIARLGGNEASMALKVFTSNNEPITPTRQFLEGSIGGIGYNAPRVSSPDYQGETRTIENYTMADLDSIFSERTGKAAVPPFRLAVFSDGIVELAPQQTGKWLDNKMYIEACVKSYEEELERLFNGRNDQTPEEIIKIVIAGGESDDKTLVLLDFPPDFNAQVCIALMDGVSSGSGLEKGGKLTAAVAADALKVGMEAICSQHKIKHEDIKMFMPPASKSPPVDFIVRAANSGDAYVDESGIIIGLHDAESAQRLAVDLGRVLGDKGVTLVSDGGHVNVFISDKSTVAALRAAIDGQRR